MTDMRRFLSALFTHALDAEAGKILIWNTHVKPRRGGHSEFFTDLDEAEKHCNSIEGKDVYVAMGTQPDGLHSNQRAKLEGPTGVTGLTALYADIDIAGPGHTSKKNYPPSQDVIMDILGTLPLKPSIVTHTGGGLQAFWLLNECWVLDTQEERNKAQHLSKSWSQQLAFTFQQARYDIDSVFDITRVLRVVGTRNQKYDHKPLVTLVDCNLTQYGTDDIASWLPDPDFSSANKDAEYQVSNMIMPTPEAEVPDCVAMLMAKDQMFSRTWEMKRYDMKDETPSAYDFAICNAGVAHGWTDHEIVTALVAFRAMHGEDVNKIIGRMPYVSKTIGNARRDFGQARATIESDEPIVQEVIETGTSEAMAKCYEMINGLTGVQVKKFIKHGKENALYTIVFANPDIEVHLGDALAMTNYNTFYCKCYDQNVHIEMNQKSWRKLCRLLLVIAEEIEVEESSMEGESKKWVANYLSKAQVAAEADWEEAVPFQKPFIKKTKGVRKVWITADALRNFIDRNMSTKVRASEVFERLRRIGFQSKTMKVKSIDASIYVWGVEVSEVTKWTAMMPKDEFIPALPVEVSE